MDIVTLLQDADPIRREAPLPDAARDRIRAVVLGAATATPSVDVVGRTRVTRLALAAAVVLLAGLLGYQVWSRGTTPVFAAVQFEVRLAEEQPAPGLMVARAPDSGGLLYLHPEVVVSNDDVLRSSVSQDGDRFGVVVELSTAGAARMRQATAAHIGRPVVILIDGAVVMAPTVRSPIGESAAITGSFTRTEAERIANGIGPR